jgi:beta-phosphoglucomutase
MSHGLGVIFDMDGVLIDTYQAHFQSWQQMTAAAGLTMTEEQFKPTFGRTSRETIASLWGQQLAANEIAALDARKEAIFRQIIARDFPAMAGAVRLLDALAEAGFAMALGSSAPPDNVEMALDRLGKRDLFSAVVTGSDVSRGKPDPQVFQIAAARLHLPPQHCAVVEDAALGVQAARQAGAAAIGLVSTGRTRESLAQADLIVDRLDQLTPATIEDVIRKHVGGESA